MKKFMVFLPIFILLTFPVNGVAQNRMEEFELMPLNLNINGRTIAKFPFVIAKDQGIYAKYGLDVDLRLREDPNLSGGISTERLFRRRRADIIIAGHAPNIMSQITNASSYKSKAIGATDCKTRAFLIGNKNESLPYEYQNKRIGASNWHTTTHYVATLLAKRKELDPVQDLSVLLRGRSHLDIENNIVDVVVMSEVAAAMAIPQGYKILEDTAKWDEPIAANSVLVNANWLEDEANHPKALAFMQAVTEALSIVHNNKALTLSLLTKWYGIDDPKQLEIIYERATYLPEKPFVCIDAVKATLDLYKSFLTDQYSPEDFYDHRFMEELEESGFLDSL